MATFPKTTVYHSALKDAGRLVITFTSEPRASKYAGKPPFVTFKVQGDDSEYQYNVESPEIEEIIKSVPRNEWVEIEAGGGKGNATLNVVELRNGNGNSNHQSPAQQYQANGNGHDSTGTGGDSLARVLWRCLETSVALHQQFEKKFGRPMGESERTLAVSLSIEVHRNNKLPLTS